HVQPSPFTSPASRIISTFSEQPRPTAGVRHQSIIIYHHHLQRSSPATRSTASAIITVVRPSRCTSPSSLPRDSQEDAAGPLRRHHHPPWGPVESRRSVGRS
ncbi:Unknown protein, partial [Striga hermonthica]